MAEPQNGKRRFAVHCSEAVANDLYQLQQRVSPARKRSISAAFRQILKQLQIDPRKAGEPAYRLPSLRLQVRKVVVRPLVIDFAVSEDLPLVFIKSGMLLGDYDN